MAVFSGMLRSDTLRMDTGLTVVLPYDRAEPSGGLCKVFYLLHGIGECSTSWLRFSSVEHYAYTYGVAFVMPEAQRSFYLDLHYGLPYFTYMTQELPELCTRMFGIGAAPQDTYIAGLSMGGYGALRCALTYPGRFAGAASFSGALDFRDVVRNHISDRLRPEFMGALGEKLEVPDNADLFMLAETAAEKKALPRILTTCGRQDLLLDMNDRFAAHLQALGYDSAYESWEGDHEWPFWDKSLKMALDLFLLQR